MSGQKFLPWWVFIFNAVCTYKRVWGRTTNMMSTVLALQLVLFVSFHICYSNPTSSKPYTPLKSMLSFYKLCGIKKQFELVIMDLANQSFKKKMLQSFLLLSNYTTCIFICCLSRHVLLFFDSFFCHVDLLLSLWQGLGFTSIKITSRKCANYLERVGCNVASISNFNWMDIIRSTWNIVLGLVCWCVFHQIT